MKPTVYSVHAYRFGDRELRSYPVGVFPKKHAAIKAAEDEETYRGGKYGCEVTEWVLGVGSQAGNDQAAKAIREPPATPGFHPSVKAR